MDVWQSYSEVYELMKDVPFVKQLRLRHVAAMEGKNFVLDSGCGTGFIAAELACRNSRKVAAVDLNPGMLEQARRRLKMFSNTRVFRADVHRLPFGDGWFDGQVSNNVLFAVSEPRCVVREMVRVTRRGGVISLATPRPTFDVEILIDFLRSSFTAKERDRLKDKLDLFVAANRALAAQLRNTYEPGDLSSLVLDAGCCRVLKEETVYLDQDSFVVAER